MSKSFGLTGLPSDILTDDRESIRRIAVDPQQTSFEKNFQFGFFDQFLSVPSTQQLVYKVTVGRDSILFNRSNEIWTGGRATTIPVQGVGSVDVSAGYSVGAITAGAEVAIPLDTIRAYLVGVIAITGGTGLSASLLEF